MSGAECIAGLNTSWLGRNFTHLDEIDSTNNYLMRGTGAPHGQAVTASFQTAGKGRLGRGWSDQKDAGLALSFLLRDWSVERLSALPLLVGLGVSRAVEAVAGIEAPIKWSNDVLVNGGKLCGILCESRVEGVKASVVVGLGINLIQTKEDLDRLSLVYATSLYLETGKKYGREVMAAAVLNQMEPLLEDFKENGFQFALPEYKRLCVTLGREVILTGPDGTTREGVAVDVSDTGDLICSIGNKLLNIRAGEVSVRGLYGYI